MLVDEIKKANVQSIKDHDTVARSVYSVVINKIMLAEIKNRESGASLTDADVVAILQKTIKELTEEAENYARVNNLEQRDVIERQKAILSTYLPKMLSESEIADIIRTLDDRSVPAVMKYFKANYAGSVDMGLVSSVLRSL